MCICITYLSRNRLQQGDPLHVAYLMQDIIFVQKRLYRFFVRVRLGFNFMQALADYE